MCNNIINNLLLTVSNYRHLVRGCISMVGLQVMVYQILVVPGSCQAGVGY
jgi:hypothetical protein